MTDDNSFSPNLIQDSGAQFDAPPPPAPTTPNVPVANNTNDIIVEPQINPNSGNNSSLNPTLLSASSNSGKKYGSKKIFASIFGLAFLIAGLVSGIVIIQQRIEIRKKATNETGQIAIFKFICDQIGKQDVCNGRDTSLSDYFVDFKVHSGSNDQGPIVQTITVKISDNDQGKGNTGSGSQGRSVGEALSIGTYTVCEIPVARNNVGNKYSLEVEPRPTASQGGSSGGTNQSQFGDNCIKVDLTPGTAELKYLDKKLQPISASCQNIKAYSTGWKQLTPGELGKLSAGQKVRFAVGGTASAGNFDKAKFRVNDYLSPDITSQKPGSQEFFYEYTIKTSDLGSKVKVSAWIHHAQLDTWF